MAMSVLCDPNKDYLVNDTIVVEDEVTTRRISDHWTNNSSKGNYVISLKTNGYLVNPFLKTLYETAYLKNICAHAPYIPVWSHSLLLKFQSSGCNVASKAWTKYFSFLQHDVWELNMGTIRERKIGQLFDAQFINYSDCVYDNYKSTRKQSFIDTQNYHGCHNVYSPFNKYFEAKHLESDGKHENHGLQVGQLWVVSNNAQNVDLNLLPKTELGLAFHPLHHERRKEDILLFFEFYIPEKEEFCFAGRFFVKASGKPSEILTKLIEFYGFMPCEIIELYGAGVKFVFAVISKYCQELTFGVLHPRFQLCKRFCIKNSFSKRSVFTSVESCSIGWIMRSCVVIQGRHFCSLVFKVPPMLLPLLDLQNIFWTDRHVHPSLIETAASRLPELPQEILMDIFSLLEIPDLLRAASVCSSWNSAYSRVRSIGHYRQAQTPCLVYTSESTGENVACLYSLAEKRAYQLTLPEPPIHRRYLIGSSHGWLVTVDEQSEMHLVNPVTSEQITLPSVTTIEQVTPIFDNIGVICKYQYSQHTAQSVTGPPLTLDLGKLRDYLHRKAIVFHDKSAGSYIVVFIHSPFGQLSFARLGDEKWTWLPPHTHVEDCIYKDGLLYAVTLFGEIFALNLSRSVAATKKIIGRTQEYYGNERVYIVQAPWGDLLQIRRPELWIEDNTDEYGHGAYADHGTFRNSTVRMEIHKVCIATKALVEINSLDGHVLFLGHNQSLCSRAEEYPQLKSNHVYFTDDAACVSSKCKWGYRLIVGVLNFENKRLEEIISPSPWSNCLAPLIMIPNPRKRDSA